MNIIITLPKILANLIYEGEKTIEVRKNWPMRFDPKKDVVYICEKGSGCVTGMFAIKGLTASKKPRQAWKQHHKDICINNKWWDRYTENCPEIFLWHIDYAVEFEKQYPLLQYFGVNKAPQSYVYTNTEWFVNSSFMVEIERSNKKAVQ